MHIYIYIHTYECIYICIYIYIHMHVYLHLHLRAGTHIHGHIHIHMHMHINNKNRYTSAYSYTLNNGLSWECAFRALFLGLCSIRRFTKTRNNIFGLLEVKCEKAQKTEKPNIFRTLGGEMWKTHIFGDFGSFRISPPRVPKYWFVWLSFFFEYFPHFTSKCPKILVVFLWLVLFFIPYFTSKNPIFCMFHMWLFASLVPKVLKIFSLHFASQHFRLSKRFGIQTSAMEDVRFHQFCV